MKTKSFSQSPPKTILMSPRLSFVCTFLTILTALSTSALAYSAREEVYRREVALARNHDILYSSTNTFKKRTRTVFHKRERRNPCAVEGQLEPEPQPEPQPEPESPVNNQCTYSDTGRIRLELVDGTDLGYISSTLGANQLVRWGATREQAARFSFGNEGDWTSIKYLDTTGLSGYEWLGQMQYGSIYQLIAPTKYTGTGSKPTKLGSIYNSNGFVEATGWKLAADNELVAQWISANSDTPISAPIWITVDRLTAVSNIDIYNLQNGGNCYQAKMIFDCKADVITT